MVQKIRFKNINIRLIKTQQRHYFILFYGPRISSLEAINYMEARTLSVGRRSDKNLRQMTIREKAISAPLLTDLDREK